MIPEESSNKETKHVGQPLHYKAVTRKMLFEAGEIECYTRQFLKGCLKEPWKANATLAHGVCTVILKMCNLVLKSFEISLFYNEL